MPIPLRSNQIATCSQNSFTKQPKNIIFDQTNPAKKTMQTPHQLINFRRNAELPHIIDVEIRDLATLRRYDSIEFHLVVFPYSRKVTTNDIKVQPFQDYAEDISQHQRSAYTRIPNNSNKQFGMTLAAIVVMVVLVFHPEDFTSAESLVSMFGAYVVGKELGNDIGRYLVEWTKNNRLRYTDSYYSYQLEKSTTLMQYSSFAMKNRYGEVALHPQRMEYLEQSSSKTVRMWFDQEDLAVEGNTAHLVALRIREDLLAEMEEEGYMLGVKVSLNTHRWWGGRYCQEFFQSWSRGESGCLGVHGQWKQHSIFYRQTLMWRHWKWFKAKGWKEGADMVGFYE